MLAIMVYRLSGSNRRFAIICAHPFCARTVNSLEGPGSAFDNSRPMTPALASLAASVPTARDLATSDAVATRTLPSVAEYAGAHTAAGPSPILVVIAAGFVLVGAWMLVSSARARG